MTRSWRPAELLLFGLGITKPSEIDVPAIAAEQGVKIKIRDLAACEARIVGHNDRAIVTVSAAVKPRRRRFSIAHELGHWHHHRGKSFSCRGTDIDNAANGPLNPERQADDYASDLLLPWYLFEPAVKDHKQITAGYLKELADMFDASHTATAIRIAEANVEPLIIACYNSTGRRWFRSSKDVPTRWWPVDQLDRETYAYDVLADA